MLEALPQLMEEFEPALEGLEELLRLWISTPSLPRDQLVRSLSVSRSIRDGAASGPFVRRKGSVSTSKSSDLGWRNCRGRQPSNCLCMPQAIRFQASRMPIIPLCLVRRGESGSHGTCLSLSLLLYRLGAKRFCFGLGFSGRERQGTAMVKST